MLQRIAMSPEQAIERPLVVFYVAQSHFSAGDCIGDAMTSGVCGA